MRACDEYCYGPGPEGHPCELPVFRLSLCMAHAQQKVRGGKLKPITEKLSPEAKLLEMAAAWVEADPEDDAEYETCRRAVLGAARALGRKENVAAMHAGLAAARAAGRRIGRAPRVSDDELRRVFARLGNIRQVAVGFGYHPSSVRKRLGRLAVATAPAAGP